MFKVSLIILIFLFSRELELYLKKI